MIRKVILGPNPTKESMHYTVGQMVFNNQYKIDSIRSEDSGNFLIFIEKDGEIVKWKEINQSVPTIIEYSLKF